MGSTSEAGLLDGIKTRPPQPAFGDQVLLKCHLQLRIIAAPQYLLIHRTAALLEQIASRIRATPPLRRFGHLLSGGGKQLRRQGHQMFGGQVGLDGRERQKKVELAQPEILVGLQRPGVDDGEITRATYEMAGMVLQHSLDANRCRKLIQLAIKVDDPDSMRTHHLCPAGT